MNLADTVRLARAEILDRTARTIDDSCPLDEDAFTDALRAVRAAGVQAKDIANRHGMAVSTVTRWEQGVNQPHPVLRKALGPCLAILARRSAQKLRDACESAVVEAIAA